jgi:hypothetical protein
MQGASMRHVVLAAVFLLAIRPSIASESRQRNLTFEDRVKAQGSIERVYYRHQEGATKPFEQAVPRSVLERKVRAYLKQSVALDYIWKTPVTAEALHRELERMTRDTQMADRLRELFAALGDDPFVIEECLARATLVDRLTRNFYAFDQVVHAETRDQAAQLRARLAAHEVDQATERPDRFVVEFIVGDPKGNGQESNPASHPSQDDPSRVTLSRSSFRDRRAKLRSRPGETSDLIEERDSFVMRVVLSESKDSARVATYIVPKRSWDEWWQLRAPGLREDQAKAVSSNAGQLPIPRSPEATCDLSDHWDNGVLDDLPSARWGHVAVWTGSEMVVWGGSGNGGSLNTGGRYDPATDTWRPTSKQGAPSGGSVGVWTGTEMIVWGGTGGIYNPGTDTWRSISTTGAPSGGTGAVWTGTEMIVWGAPGGRYNPATDTWTAMSTEGAPQSGGYTASGVWTGRLLVVWGSAYTPNSGGRYDPASDTWMPVSDVGAPFNHGGEAVWTGTEMLIWGVSAGGRYDPVTDTWLPISTFGAPNGEVFGANSAVWTGSVMVVWGGNEGIYPMKSGSRYDPATDTWRPTSVVGAPPGRYYHTAVWTGSHMIVWGGMWGNNTGGRYDPVTDSWTPTSTVGPASGDRATAIWTGSRMIVWGGSALWVDWFEVTPSVNVGGRYDPATDTWSPMATVGAPSARTWHTAVWTGSKMMVWGGRDKIPTDTILNTGGIYDPVTDVWTATSTDGAPSARFGHSAVWTGDEMVVWGGHDYTGPHNDTDTGGRYNPGTDTWSATSAVGSPSPQSSHTAVWTGRLMVIWGGPDVGGGRYDPATDTWTPVAPFDAAGPALWTGREMLVGSCGGGGRYDPATDTWLPLPANGSAASCSGSSVWTGELMIVCGGRYNPGTNYWTPMTTVDEPDCGGQPAVWTGTQMVVWGENSRGGRYDPGSPDADEDGLCDQEDNCPLISNPAQVDGDSDGVGDACDTCTDADHDGFGSGTLGNNGCPAGPTTDCDDINGSVFPGAPELCDGINDNCSDPKWPAVSVNEADVDHDGFRDCGGDCNDGNPSVHPGVAEVCNGIDDNCSGQIDEDTAGADSDGDGVHNACDNCRFAYNPTQLDTDLDGVGNSCDNCVFVANLSQADTDSDGRGNACDNCPIDSNSFQDDYDKDGVGDACDKCLFDFDPSQSDFDNDGEGDVCDLNDGLILIYGTDDKNYIEWQAEIGPQQWNVYTGDLAVLRSTGVYTQTPGSNALAFRYCGLVDTFEFDAGAPTAGAVEFSLVTGVTIGAEASLGKDSLGNERTNANPCP